MPANKDEIENILERYGLSLATNGRQGISKNEAMQLIHAREEAQKQEWECLLDRAVNGEVVKVVRNGVTLHIGSSDGMRDGMQRVVDSAMTLGEELGRVKKERVQSQLKENKEE